MPCELFDFTLIGRLLLHTYTNFVLLQLACARIGAVHSVVFAGFSAESLAGRICDSKPAVVLCCSSVKRGPKAISLKVRTLVCVCKSAAQCTFVAGTLECRAACINSACIVLVTPVSSCPLSQVPSPESRASCPTLPMSHVTSPESRASCPKSYAFHVPSPKSHASCPKSHVPCPKLPMSQVPCPISQAP